MNERCKICIDPSCNGRMDCDCSTCTKKDTCYREIRPTVRVTKRCTQSCKHCCFECSPKSKGEMSLDMAQKISTFLRTNGIDYVNVMGGEFWLFKRWEEIVGEIVDPVSRARVVTNGDWVARPKVKAAVLSFATRHPQVYFAISKDCWHTNKHVDEALAVLSAAGIPNKIQDEDDPNSVVPVGNGEYHEGIYSYFSTYCSKPDRMYSPLIDEEGWVYRCGFGIWDYTNIENHLDGSFHEQFKKFGLKFNSIFISNCQRCQMSYRFQGKRK